MESKPLTPGTKVRVVDREPTSADAKSRLFFPHFRNLTGTVQRVFADGAEVQVVIDLESLPEDIRSRHFAAQEAMRKRIAESLSGEARERVGSEVEQLNLPYSILVSPEDLIPIHGSPGQRPRSAKAKAEDEVPPSARSVQASASATGPPEAAHRPSRRSERRITEQELNRREEELLKSKQEGRK
ncbi:MAG: hypothetical protein ACUVRO_11930 [Armatimonadota bacterium]